MKKIIMALSVIVGCGCFENAQSQMIVKGFRYAKSKVDPANTTG
jgi:hypothetical protein